MTIGKIGTLSSLSVILSLTQDAARVQLGVWTLKQMPVGTAIGWLRFNGA